METISFSKARENLASTFDSVTKNSNPIVITRQNKEPVVVISMSDFKSIEETAYLMQSVKNAKRLNSAIDQLECGLGKTKELIEV